MSKRTSQKGRRSAPTQDGATTEAADLDVASIPEDESAPPSSPRRVANTRASRLGARSSALRSGWLLACGRNETKNEACGRSRADSRLTKRPAVLSTLCRSAGGSVAVHASGMVPCRARLRDHLCGGLALRLLSSACPRVRPRGSRRDASSAAHP